MKQTSNEILKNLQRIQGKDDYTLLHDFFIMSAISIRNSVDNRPSEHEKFEKILSRKLRNRLKINQRRKNLMLKMEAETKGKLMEKLMLATNALFPKVSTNNQYNTNTNLNK